MNKSTKYSKVLFILHMPPPVHGASMVGKYIHDSKIINEKNNFLFIGVLPNKLPISIKGTKNIA